MELSNKLFNFHIYIFLLKIKVSQDNDLHENEL